MESIPESWLLLSDESFVLKDSRLSFCCDDSSLNAILQDSRLGWFDFLGPEIFKKIYKYIGYIYKVYIYTYRRQGFLKIHYYYKDGLNVFLKKKSENIVFRLGSGSNKEKTTYLPNKVSNGSGTLKLGFG